MPTPNELSLSPGWRVVGPFTLKSDIISVPAGAGTLAVARTSVLTWSVGPRARLYIKDLALRIVDAAGFDQIIFALRNNTAVQSPFDQINAVQVSDWHFIEVDTEYGPGAFDVAATNISGTIYPGANLNPGAINVIVGVKGWNLGN